MPGLRVLFLGGTGIISSACSWLAVERGIDLLLLNRDKAHSMVFDNAKLRSVVPGYRAVIPFEQGAREIVAWHDEDPSRQRIDAGVDALSDKLAQAWRPGS
jgi:hypothetical protein